MRSGINHEKWQQHLLAEGDKLTYNKAYELLLVLEAAEKRSKGHSRREIRTPTLFALNEESTPVMPTVTGRKAKAVLLMWRIAQRGQVSLSKSQMVSLPQNWPYCFSLSTESKATQIHAGFKTKGDT